jgi:hypothetical protein
MFQNTSRDKYLHVDKNSMTMSGINQKKSVKYYQSNKNDSIHVNKFALDEMRKFSRFDENRQKEDEIMDKKYKFRMKTNDEQYEYNPPKKTFTYYQICQFKLNGVYHVRKIYYNEKLEIKSYKESIVKKKKLNKFIENCNDNKFAMYPVYNLDNVDFPSDNQVLLASSLILNNEIYGASNE